MMQKNTELLRKVNQYHKDPSNCLSTDSGTESADASDKQEEPFENEENMKKGAIGIGRKIDSRIGSWLMEI